MDGAQLTRTPVLYVDDEQLACKYFARAAGDEYEVMVAGSVDDALSILMEEGGRIAILVTDFRMPGATGGALLRQVGSDYPQMVKILVTAHADKDMLLETVNTGEVFRILEKPLGVAQVREALAQARDRHRERMDRFGRLSAIDETLAFLAHELNTPLAAIANFARGVESRSGAAYAPERQAEIGQAAAVMQSNAQYCLAVISSFLQSVRGEQGRPLASGTEREVTAGALISTLLDTYPFSGGQRGWITVEIESDFIVEALPNCVALVLSSLLSNALRALGEVAQPRLTFEVQGLAQASARTGTGAETETGIEAGGGPADGGLPAIRIRDNGPGIPPDVLGRLLVDPVTTHAGAGGNGLGMIFCNRVMQSFGGSVRIESAAGNGTLVTLAFPSSKNRMHRSDR